MGIKIVRTPSETPNITNVDDIIPFRYAYGNQNGYVIGRGSQLDGSYESGEFTVGSGRAVIQGVEVDIDANGISTTLNTASETRYFKIYLKVNLANDVAVLESYYSTVSYDEITDPTSSDLISGGDAYLLLYTLQLSGTTQVEKNKVVKSITYRDAETINGVSITQDNNGVLHSGEEIICKKKLLWSGDFSFTGSEKKFTGLTYNAIAGKKIEFIFEQNTLEVGGFTMGYFTWTIPEIKSRSQCIYNRVSNDLKVYSGFVKCSSQSNEISFYSSVSQGTNYLTFHLYKIYEIIE